MRSETIKITETDANRNYDSFTNTTLPILLITMVELKKYYYLVSTVLYKMLRIFISSPGDVPKEREYAALVIRSLNKDPFFESVLSARPVAWDQGGGAPMDAHYNPQEAINMGMPKPSECDIVIVILWARMGTLLPPNFVKDNGERFLSGTEWEHYDAMHAPQVPGKPVRPGVFIYRCERDLTISPTDTKVADTLDQLLKVQKFFANFKNPDGSFSSYAKSYKTPEEFRSILEVDLRNAIMQWINAK